MSDTLTIVAKIEANNANVELVKSELLRLIEPTLKETGCIQYELHQDNQNPRMFVFHETWESHQRWQNHMNTTHVAEYIKAVDGAISTFTVNEMTKL